MCKVSYIWQLNQVLIFSEIFKGKLSNSIQTETCGNFYFYFFMFLLLWFTHVTQRIIFEEVSNFKILKSLHRCFSLK